MHGNFKFQTEQLLESLHDATNWHQQISKTIEYLKEAFLQQKKVLVAGNGGSATLAQHFTDEMVGRYRVSREYGTAGSLLGRDLWRNRSVLHGLHTKLQAEPG